MTLYPKFFVNKAKLFDILVIFTYDSCKYLFSDISQKSTDIKFYDKTKTKSLSTLLEKQPMINKHAFMFSNTILKHY